MIAERSQALTQPAKAGLLAPKHLLRPPWSARGTRELSPTASRVNPFLLGVNPAPASLLERRTPSVVEPQSPPRGGRREWWHPLCYTWLAVASGGRHLRTRGFMLKRNVSVSRPAGRLPPSVEPHALSRAGGQEADAFASKDCPPPPGIQEDGFQVTIAGNKEARGAFHLYFSEMPPPAPGNVRPPFAF